VTAGLHTEVVYP